MLLSHVVRLLLTTVIVMSDAGIVLVISDWLLSDRVRFIDYLTFTLCVMDPAVVIR